MQVTPYWAITYAPTAFQPAKPIDQTTQLAQCLGYEDSPGKYQCRPAAGTVGATAGFDDCWKCPPKVNTSFDLYCCHFMACLVEALRRGLNFVSSCYASFNLEVLQESCEVHRNAQILEQSGVRELRPLS